MLWFCDNWKDNKTRYVGRTIEEPMIYCYFQTGDKRLLDFCVDYETYLCENDLFLNSKNAFLDTKLYYNSNHTAGYVCSVRNPALVYTANNDKSFLEASINGIDKLRKKAMHTTGAPVCNFEYLSPVSYAAESEYCYFTFINASYAIMSAVTGDARYGDYMEQVVYNAAQGARKKDEKAYAYNSSPNQIYATDVSSNYKNTYQMHAPIHPVSCCAANAVAIIPDFVRNMAMIDNEDNIYLNAYGPCEINHNGIKIIENTLYPFREDIEFIIVESTQKEFSICVKIPAWCDDYEVSVNSKLWTGIKNENLYMKLKHIWLPGDRIHLKLKMKPAIIRVDDTDSGKKYPLSVNYGALTFSLPIPEKWKNEGNGQARTPLPEGWAWYSVVPDMNYRREYDVYELKGIAQYLKPWHVALDEKTACNSMEVVEMDASGYVWENPPLKIILEGYRAPFCYSAYPKKTQEIYEEKVTVTEKMTLTLVPYGCTNLRITYFPRADLD